MPFPVTVTAMDAYGNVATGYVGTIDFSSTDPAAEFPVTYNGNVYPAAVVPATLHLRPRAARDGHLLRHLRDIRHPVADRDRQQALRASPALRRGSPSEGGSAALANPDATATTFANPMGSATSGQSVTLTATVKTTTTGVANPTDGSVTFYYGLDRAGHGEPERLGPGHLADRPSLGGYVQFLRGL